MNINIPEGLKPGYEQIYNHCLNNRQMNPIVLADELMNLPGIPMHGPIHHFLVPATILSCFHYGMNSTKEELASDLEKAANKSVIVPGANCASCNACGAGLGVGIASNIITNNGPLSTDTWSKVLKISANCNLAIANYGGPRCCKRDVYLAILEGVKQLEKELNIKLPVSQPTCTHSSQNAQCLGIKCPFHKNK